MRLREERERAWKDFESLRALVRGDGVGREGGGELHAQSGGEPKGFGGTPASRIR